ncbi:efflux RND transporter periplasmic adaptor subunit [Teredinibacter franksiae]|uniref:efflux RND transporter periplasmic adaptor subunit n=1 Tax=Teredinibacter franksiae TaxID=2761453 RepID=UPI001628084D|nr:efflux RND transporter periplasmic adaptor subunit [Teredinibacter franksiae]
MGTDDDKSELLKQLTIDRSEPEPSGFTGWQLLAATTVAALLGAFVVYFLIPRQTVYPPDMATEAAAVLADKTANIASYSAPSNSPVKEARAQTRAQTDAILNASGYITARRLATVSAEIMGLITEVAVDEGMTVEQGQILATLDDSKAQVNLRLAQAQMQSQSQRVQSVVTDLEESQRVLRRLAKLGEDNYASVAQRTRAQANVAKLKAALASARADLNVSSLNVERTREQLDDHTIRAPFAGVITVKNAQPGEIVAPAAAGGGFTRTGICTLVDMGSLEIEVDVNEAYIGRVLPGQKVIANLDAYPEWDIPASVIAIIPTADRAKATVRVRIKIINSDKRILPNMGVKVAFYSQINE